jgi:hypothetical protein
LQIYHFKKNRPNILLATLARLIYLPSNFRLYDRVKMSESTTNSTITDGSLLEISDAQLEGSDNEQENGELSSDGGSPKILSPNSSIKVGAEYGEPKKKKYKKLGKKYVSPLLGK